VPTYQIVNIAVFDHDALRFRYFRGVVRVQFKNNAFKKPERSNKIQPVQKPLFDIDHSKARRCRERVLPSATFTSWTRSEIAGPTRNLPSKPDSKGTGQPDSEDLARSRGYPRRRGSVGGAGLRRSPAEQLEFMDLRFYYRNLQTISPRPPFIHRQKAIL